MGRPGTGGGGRFKPGAGDGAESAAKFFCWFKAAMRCARDVNCGSSVSAIVKSVVDSNAVVKDL